MNNRGKVRRAYIKLYITGWLHGSIRWQLDAQQRGVWADLLALAGECGQGGSICDNDGRPYPMEYIAGQLNISPELLNKTIEVCKKEGRVDKTDGIVTISNWKVYQSEYERQKPYREARKQASAQDFAGQKFSNFVQK